MTDDPSKVPKLFGSFSSGITPYELYEWRVTKLHSHFAFRYFENISKGHLAQKNWIAVLLMPSLVRKDFGTLEKRVPGYNSKLQIGAQTLSRIGILCSAHTH